MLDLTMTRASVGLLPLAGFGLAAGLCRRLPAILELGWRGAFAPIGAETAMPPTSSAKRRRAAPFLAVLPLLAVLAGSSLTTAALFGLGIFLSGLAILAAADREFGLVPDLVVLPLAAIGLAAAATGCSPTSWPGALAGLAIGWLSGKAVGRGLALAAGRDPDAGFGSGDVKLLAAIGAWLGGPAPYLACTAAFLVFCLHRRWRSDAGVGGRPVPFGPYLFTATAGMTPLWTSLVL